MSDDELDKYFHDLKWTPLPWRDRRVRLTKGYKERSLSEHPFPSEGWVLEHRLTIEDYHGRYLLPESIVHHANENKLDNRVENLYLCDEMEHAKIHRMGKTISNKHKVAVRKKQQQRSFTRDENGRFTNRKAKT